MDGKRQKWYRIVDEDGLTATQRSTLYPSLTIISTFVKCPQRISIDRHWLIERWRLCEQQILHRNKITFFHIVPPLDQTPTMEPFYWCRWDWETDSPILWYIDMGNQQVKLQWDKIIIDDICTTAYLFRVRFDLIPTPFRRWHCSSNDATRLLSQRFFWLAWIRVIYLKGRPSWANKDIRLENRIHRLIFVILQK